MNISKSQSGIAHLIIIIVVVVVGAIGLIGWRLYGSELTSSGDAVYGPSNRQPTKQTDGASDANVPDGFKAYESKDMGVAFAYPQAWGDVVVNPGPETNHLVNGSEYELKFSATKAVFAGVRSADWTHDPEAGHDGSFYAGSFTNFKHAEYTMYSDVVTYINDDTSMLISAGVGGLGCNAVAELLVRQLEDNATYPAIAFLYIDKLMDYDSGDKEAGIAPEDICADENYKKYISTEHAEELKKVNATIKVLE